MNKSALRKIYLERRVNLAPAERARKSALIAERFFASFDLSGVRFLHGFVSLEKFGEVNTHPIFERVRREFPRIVTAAPRADWTRGKIESVPFSASSAFVRNKFGIDEPANGETIAPEKIDIVLTPLLCFDQRGYRVGYGKGMYDVFFQDCRPDCRKIGLSFFPAIEKITDVGDFDIRLDACVTPESVTQFGV